MQNKYELPISIETLAAYLDGSLPREEMERIGNLAQENDMLRAMINASDNVDAIKEDTVINEIDLPSLEEIEIPSGDVDSIWDADDYDPAIIDQNIDSFINDELLVVGDSIESELDSINIEQIKHTHMSTKTYGYEPNYELEPFDPNIYQGYDNTCAVRAQQIILRDYGIMIPQDKLVEYAKEQGWFDDGTVKEDVGNILDACGIETTRTENATIFDLIAELRAGHRVIVSVDADELWLKKDPSLISRLFGNISNHISDGVNSFLGLEGANHALVVAGVTVNPKDPSDIHVILTDPGTGEVCIEYSLKEFEPAWADGNHLMVSTNVPAPYQYNYETQQMEPSGFASEFIPANIQLPENTTNSFHLSESYYDTYEDYNELYSSDSPIPLKTFLHHNEDTIHDDASKDITENHESDSDDKNIELEDKDSDRNSADDSEYDLEEEEEDDDKYDEREEEDDDDSDDDNMDDGNQDSDDNPDSGSMLGDDDFDSVIDDNKNN